ncbi:MAG TPA: four-carbon acid sugar kinase family protein, partial [Devosia sp.]|nr:four-carbon acid sugar kinase family protein [Devosia sp.]
DMIGALDAAAAFGAFPASVRWHEPLDGRLPPGHIAISSETRELSAASAYRRTMALAGTTLVGGLPFKKFDSLLRGNVGAEIAACLGATGFATAVIAPAAPRMGRVTRGGRQYWTGPRGNENILIPVDIVACLKRYGIDARLARPGAAITPGVTIFDAEIDADLGEIVRQGRASALDLLWCGTSGLARALGADNKRSIAVPPGPILGIVGTGHAVIQAQIEALASAATEIIIPVRPVLGALGAVVRRVDRRTRSGQSSLVHVAGASHGAAAVQVILEGLGNSLARPQAAFVSAGETCRIVCDTLGSTELELQGEYLPGVALSRMLGGRWGGVPLYSKSGAFGDRTTLLKLYGISEE